MSIKCALVSLAAFAICLSAQMRDMDPAIKNYKLTMEKIKAFDGVEHKVMAAANADPGFKSSLSTIGQHKTLNEMAAAVDANAKLSAMVKAGGITSREFCVVPLAVMTAGTADMIQTQYKKDVSDLVTPENLAFFRANKAQIGPLAQSWTSDK